MDSRLRRLLVGAAAAVACVSLADAQNTVENAGPIILPPTAPGPVVLPENAVTPETAPINAAPLETEAPRRSAPVTPPKPQLPPGPPPPTRSPTAILRVLDKVTAETLRFAAPVGRRVRYKSLIFIVKTCETRDLSDPLPKPSAYVVIDSEPQAQPGQAAPPARRIYRGWMFANSPGLHPFEHPVYDAWLESCAPVMPQ